MIFLLAQFISGEKGPSPIILQAYIQALRRQAAAHDEFAAQARVQIEALENMLPVLEASQDACEKAKKAEHHQVLH